MAGIYIHIPFCKQACYYCDFYFSTSLKNKDAFINALLAEINLQKNYLGEESVDTIYFGGGTPSLLSEYELAQIFESLYKTFSINPKAEITLEANPDDLSDEKILLFKKKSINRLSIGIQSFFDIDLKWMNRVHTSSQSTASVKRAQDAGFENITIDLIYGIPTLSNDDWKNNLLKAFSLNVNHISSYSLTVEPKTALANFIKKGKVKDVDELQSAHQFEIMLELMKQNGFIQYEISNFCKSNFYSKHNSNYWLRKKYLGLGPSAHSYDGNNRQWNVSNNSLYINSLAQNKLNFEIENLSQNQRYNEYVLTSLRTIWGIDKSYIKYNFGAGNLNYLQEESEKYLKSNKMVEIENKLFLTDEGKLLADKIASDLFKLD